MEFKFFERKGEFLQSTFRFSDFKTAFAFMTDIANAAEKLNHHPDWSNSYNVVEIKLTTQDVGGKLTELDFKLAAAIELLVDKYRLK